MSPLSLRAMRLAKEDQEVFNADSNKALFDALQGSSKVVLNVETARDLGSINYMIQVCGLDTSLNRDFISHIHAGFISIVI